MRKPFQGQIAGRFPNLTPPISNPLFRAPPVAVTPHSGNTNSMSHDLTDVTGGGKGRLVVRRGDPLHDAGWSTPVRVHRREVHVPPHPGERVRLPGFGARQRQRQESRGEAAAGVCVCCVHVCVGVPSFLK